MDGKMREALQEVIDVGDCALIKLQQANKYLESAGRWGFVDIFGGGILVSGLKHIKVRRAYDCIEQAKEYLQVFIKELRDVDWIVQDIDLGILVTFADFFFDGILTDVIMQAKIEKAKGQVREAIIRVDAILTKLHDKLQGAV